MKYRRLIQAMLLVVLCICLAAGAVACHKDNPPTPENPGDSYLVDTDKAPQDLTADNAIYAFLKKQSELKSYMITTKGEVVADFAGYRQTVETISYKNGSDYLNQSQSSSTLVKMKHQAFAKDGKVVYRDSFDGEMKVAKSEDYAKYYGLTPDAVGISGYIINPKTLRYATLEKTDGDKLTYYIRLAGDDSLAAGSSTESASTSVRIQTYAFGSLDKIPSFSDIDIRLTIKKDWTPVSYTVDCSYSCKKVFDMTVKQTLNCTYSNVNGTVEIPNASDFAAKLGSTPSEVKPSVAEKDPLMKVASAIGSAFEDDTLELPFTASAELFGSSLALSGNLSLKIVREALNKGDTLNAFKFRLDVDLSTLPLISGLANTLTMRYFGEGQLFLMLNQRTEGKDNIIYTHTADISEFMSKDISIDELSGIINKILTETDSGYTLTLGDEFIANINNMYASFIAEASAALGDEKGILNSFLGMTFDSVTFELEGKDKISAVALNVDTTPAENTMKGEKIGVSISVGILGGAIATPITGDLMLRLEPSALWEGDYFAMANAHLHLDLKSAGMLLQMLGQFASFGLPAFLGTTDSLDIYYMGDGILSIVFNDAEGLPINVTEIDLKETASDDTTDDETTAKGIADELGDGENEGTDEGTGEGTGEGSEEIEQPGLLPFTLTIDKNSICLALGEPMVQAINAAYNALVQQIVDEAVEAAGGPDDFLGMMAGQVISGFLAADITDIEFLLGRDEKGMLMFDFSIRGDYNKTEDVLLLGLTLNDKGELTEEERNELLSDKSIAEVREYNEKAAELAAKLQDLIDNMDVTDSGYNKYVEDVKALQEEIEKEGPSVESLMPNNSYLVEKEYDGTKYSVLLLTAKLYRDRVVDFKDKLSKTKDSTVEAEWDALIALYDKATNISGINVPAIKDSEILQKAVGEDNIETYTKALDTYEKHVVEELKKEIEAAQEKYGEATGRNDLIAALTQIANEFKPIFTKLSDAKKELIAKEYYEYYVLIYTKGLTEVTNVYKEIEKDIKKLIGADTEDTETEEAVAETDNETEDGNGETGDKEEAEKATFDKLIPILRKLAEAQAWSYGTFYWDRSVTGWGPGYSNTKPTGLDTDKQDKINTLLGDHNTIYRSLIRGEDSEMLFEAMKDVFKTEVESLMEKLEGCKKENEEGETEYDFSELVENKKDGEELLEEIRAVRYLFFNVLYPTKMTDLFDDNEDVMNFLTEANLKAYEAALSEHISKMGDSESKLAA